MKFYTPDKSLLIDVSAVKEHQDGLIIEGKIMGSLPMKAILRHEDLRSAFRLVTWGVVRRALTMLICGKNCGR
jgi:hypothetical protein